METLNTTKPTPTLQKNIMEAATKPDTKPPTKRNKELHTLPESPCQWIADGVDHININHKGDTELGRFLSNNSNFNLTHSQFGNFKYVLGFWYFIKCEKVLEKLRFKEPQAIRTLIRNTPKREKVDNFQAVIVDATWQKIKQHKNYHRLLAESTLPFDCWYTNPNSGIRIRLPFYNWLCYGYDILRDAARRNVEPDLTPLMDNLNIGLYDDVMNHIKSNSGKAVNKTTEELLAEEFSKQTDL